MKKLLTLTALAAASLLIAKKSDAQIYVGARVGFPFRGPRVYVAPPPVVYSTPAPVYTAPPPAYQEPYDDGAYVDPNGYPSSDGVVYEDQFPGYAYYDFPAWNGHYRDYYYYAHYRPFFERRYAGYFNGGRFDRGRFVNEHFNHGYAGGGFNHGYATRGFVGHPGFAGHPGFVGHPGGFAGHPGFAGHGGFSGHGGGHGRR